VDAPGNANRSATALAAPALLTFDVFGTVLDWRAGMTDSLARRGIALGDRFDRVVDRQGALEQALGDAFERYASITATSLVEVLGVDPVIAAAIGDELGAWPLFAESASALKRLMTFAPCAAMTNSDRAHGARVTETLGFELSHRLSAEDVRVYKPSPKFWHAARERTGAAFGPSWWHVSAYADYDLDAASALGLTTVFIRRPHSREGRATLTFPTLAELATAVTAIDSDRA
jgi:2-haloacid dehalogenase